MASEAKVALVTGSSSGIGEATVKLLAKKGYKVVIVGSNKEKVDRVHKECLNLSPHGYEHLALVLDFSDPENGAAAVNKTIDHFGRLDVLINNVGVFNVTLANESSYEMYRYISTINTDAAVKTTLAAVEHLKKAKGNLVFVSSVSSVKAYKNFYAYCMSKAALSMFSKVMATELAPEVRVNTVSPGPVFTSIMDRLGLNRDYFKDFDATTLLDRIAISEEIAEPIAFLVSNQASYITGHELFIDGGLLLKNRAPGSCSVFETNTDS